MGIMNYYMKAVLLKLTKIREKMDIRERLCPDDDGPLKKHTQRAINMGIMNYNMKASLLKLNKIHENMDFRERLCPDGDGPLKTSTASS